jgi:dihydrofolate reductase
MGRAVAEDYDTADVLLLLGRETYDSFAGAWPDREAAGGDDTPFARRIGDLRKVVASCGTPTFTRRNSELIGGDLVDAVAALEADPGVTGVLIPGSISVVQQLLAAGLVDELRLLVHPVAASALRDQLTGSSTPVARSYVEVTCARDGRTHRVDDDAEHAATSAGPDGHYLAVCGRTVLPRP